MKRLTVVAGVLGALLIAGGLYVGFQTVRRDDLICGQALSSNHDYPSPDFSKIASDAGYGVHEGVLYSDGKGGAECALSLSTHRVIALSTSIPGAALIVGGTFLWVRALRNDCPSRGCG
jgi:hypothetical protein